MANDTVNSSLFEVTATWKEECGGKADYDGPIIDVSSRFWPAWKSSDNKPFAKSTIRLLCGYEPGDQTYQEAIELAVKEFRGDTEQEVKVAVMEWVSGQRAQ